MIKIVIENEIVEQIRSSKGQIELVDHLGQRIGTVRRAPTESEILIAKSRIGLSGPKSTIDELISKVEAL